jgi:hypothetical protein
MNFAATNLSLLKSLSDVGIRLPVAVDTQAKVPILKVVVDNAPRSQLDY